MRFSSREIRRAAARADPRRTAWASSTPLKPIPKLSSHLDDKERIVVWGEVLDDDRRPVRAESAAKRVADLSYGRVGPDAVQDTREQVLPSLGRIPERGERCLHPLPVPLGPHARQARPLTLQDGRIDLEQGGRLLIRTLEA